MKKFFYMIVFVLTIILSTQYSYAFGHEFSNPESNTKYEGTVGAMGGTIYVYIIYASYEGKPNISEATKSNFEKSYKEACNWIYNKSVDYDRKETFITVFCPNEIKVSNDINLNCISPDNAAEIALGLDYKNIILSEAIKKKADDYMVMVCTEEESSCKAFAASEITPFNYMEGCVINTKVWGVLSSCIIHEILHCFGAWDLYNYTKPDGTKTCLYRESDGTAYLERYLEFSVMNCTSLEPGFLKIDELTAYLVGLTRTKESWFDKLCKNGAR